MSVQSDYDKASQLDVRDDLKRNRDILAAEEFAPTAELMRVHAGLDKEGWLAKFDEQFARLRGAYTYRGRSGGRQSTESGEAAEGLSEIEKWLDDNVRTLTLAAMRGVAGARTLLNAIRLPAGTEDTYRDLWGPLDQIISELADAGDLTRFRFEADHLEVGRNLRANVEGDRAAVHGAQIGIRQGAIDGHYLLDELTDMVEELALCHAVTQGRVRRELPGFDLRYVRAARAARNAARLAAAAAPAPTPVAASNDSGL